MKLEKRFQGMPLDEARRAIRREGLAALQVAAPKISLKSERDAPVRLRRQHAEQQADGESSQPRRSLQHARIPNDAPDEVKDLVAAREKECSGCQHYSGVCTKEFPQSRGCSSTGRYRAGWLAYCGREQNHCPDGRW